MDNLEYYEATVGGFKRFDLAPVDRVWGSDKAENNIRRWASSDGSGKKDKISWSKLRTGYGYYNPAKKEDFEGYKLPFVDIVEGVPKVAFKALAAGVAVLNGACGGIDIPDNEKKTVYNLFSFYLKQFEKELPELRSENDFNFDDDEFIEKGEPLHKDFSIEINTADIQENGVFEGYASTFGGAPDSKGDIIAPGAFSETINHGGRNKNGIAMLWYHNPEEPVGVWLSLVEDSKGLKVKGQLNLEVQKGRELYSLLKMGAIKAMSIGWDFYRTANGDVRKDSYEIVEKGQYHITRLLKIIELWEISLVTFPANRRAKVTKVKSVTEANTEREMENVLRDAGLSKSDSQYVVKLCRPSLRDSKRGRATEELGSKGRGENDNKIDIEPILKSLRMTNLSLDISRRIHSS